MSWQIGGLHGWSSLHVGNLSSVGLRVGPVLQYVGINNHMMSFS